MVRRRRAQDDGLPRWVEQPLLCDWLDGRELAALDGPDGFVWRTQALYRYFEALDAWATPRGVAWQDVEHGWPRPVVDAPDIDPLVEPPPPGLVALAVERSRLPSAPR